MLELNILVSSNYHIHFYLHIFHWHTSITSTLIQHQPSCQHKNHLCTSIDSTFKKIYVFHLGINFGLLLILPVHACVRLVSLFNPNIISLQKSPYCIYCNVAIFPFPSIHQDSIQHDLYSLSDLSMGVQDGLTFLKCAKKTTSLATIRNNHPANANLFVGSNIYI